MKKIFVITGPTGVGKSKIIYNLPNNSNIEIINADSRQIYQNLFIGTASPSEEEKQKFPHHLFNFLPLNQAYSSGRYIKEAKQKIKEIHNKKKIPIIIGGTFFYIKSLWDGLAIDVDISNEVKQKIESMNDIEIREKLKEIDFISHEKIHPHDAYRNRRALMVSMAGSHPFSQLPLKGGIYNDYQFENFYLDIDREILYERINARVEKMFASGLLDEIHNLISNGCMIDDKGFNSIGYKEIINYIIDESDSNNKTMKEETDYNKKEFLKKIKLLQKETTIRQKLTDLIAKNTRNYAKRQLTWFRNEKRLKRFDPPDLIYYLSERVK